MPLDTFNKLHDDKKQTVYQAVLKEYLRVPLENVSVKNIIEDAGIPRGSFYQYFKDKEGALRYLIERTRSNDEQEMLTITRDNPNLFNFFMVMFSKEAELVKNKRFSTRMLLLNQISKSPRATSILFNDIRATIIHNDQYKKYWENSSLNSLPKETSKVILDMLFTTFKETLIKILQDNDSVTQIEQEFKLKLDIIRTGSNNIFS